MPRFTHWIIVVAGLFLPVSVCHSKNKLADIHIVAGASVGYSTFSFAEKLDHDISFPSTNLTLVVTSARWQLSINGGTTLEDATISEEEDVGKASRNDLDLTLAYQASTQWAFFTGYKLGKTKMRFIARDSEEEDTSIAVNESYAQEGPYIGTSYSWQFDKAGRLSISVGYAALDATNNFAANTDDDEEENDEIEFDDLTGRISGDLHGFSYGLSWTMPLSANLLFQTRFKLNDYQQDIKFNGTKFNNIDETFTTLHVGLAYVF